MRVCKFVGALTLTLCVTIALAPHSEADQLKFFKIGSGSKGGAYYPIAYGIATTISNPPVAKSCAEGGNCGVPGLVASAEPTGGSVSNIDGLLKEEFHAGIVQSDVAYWAYTGTGPFRTRKRAENLCAISGLYKEAFHLVRAGSSDIKNVMELKGKRVALGERGSGALLGAQLVVRAYGFAEDKDFQMVAADFQSATSMIESGSIDAFAYVTAYPNEAIKAMTEKSGARVVPVSGKGRDKLVKRYPFYTAEIIPAGTYSGQETETETLAVSALWISRKSVSNDLIYDVTKAFWKNPAMRGIMNDSHPKGEDITIRTAFEGVSIPYCEGSERFYREIGKVR